MPPAFANVLFVKLVNLYSLWSFTIGSPDLDSSTLRSRFSQVFNLIQFLLSLGLESFWNKGRTFNSYSNRTGSIGSVSSRCVNEQYCSNNTSLYATEAPMTVNTATVFQLKKGGCRNPFKGFPGIPPIFLIDICRREHRRSVCHCVWNILQNNYMSSFNDMTSCS